MTQMPSNAASSLFTEQVAELVAIGAAIAANCEPCFKYHYDQATKLGVSELDMRYAVDLAQKVKDTPARALLKLADAIWDLRLRRVMPRPTPAALAELFPESPLFCHKVAHEFI